MSEMFTFLYKCIILGIYGDLSYLRRSDGVLGENRKCTYATVPQTQCSFRSEGNRFTASTVTWGSQLEILSSLKRIYTPIIEQ